MLSRWSYRSRNSVLSIASCESFLSIGSAGSSFSIGSVGSFASIGSLGSSMSLFSALSHQSRGSVLSAQSDGEVLQYQRSSSPSPRVLAAVLVGTAAAGLVWWVGIGGRRETQGSRAPTLPRSVAGLTSS